MREHVDAADQGNDRERREEVRARVVRGDQGGGTRRVHRTRRSGEIKDETHASGDDGDERTDGVVRRREGRRGRNGDDGVIVLATRDAHVDGHARADVVAADERRAQGEALLTIAPPRFLGVDAERVGVKVRDVAHRVHERRRENMTWEIASSSKRVDVPFLVRNSSSRVDVSRKRVALDVHADENRSSASARRLIVDDVANRCRLLERAFADDEPRRRRRCRVIEQKRRREFHRKRARELVGEFGGRDGVHARIHERRRDVVDSFPDDAFDAREHRRESVRAFHRRRRLRSLRRRRSRSSADEYFE